MNVVAETTLYSLETLGRSIFLNTIYMDLVYSFLVLH